MVNASPSENMKEAGFYYIDENGNATRATNEQIANNNLSVPVSDSTQVNPDFPKTQSPGPKLKKLKTFLKTLPHTQRKTPIITPL